MLLCLSLTNASHPRQYCQALLRNADLGLSNSEIRRVLAEADEDEDGMINYHEFVPVAVQVLQGYHARKHAMELLLTGEFAGAERAREMGLVNFVVDEEGEEEREGGRGRLGEAVDDLAARIASRSRVEINWPSCICSATL